jgi:hypothetical protein
MRLVPANVAWGAWVVAIVLIGFAWPLGGLLLLPTLALPTAATFRVAARIARVAPDAGLRDIAWAYCQGAGPTLLLGTAIALAALVLATNVATGIGGGTPIGWVIATLAGWALVALWCGALVAWPLVVDPARAGTPLAERLRLAGALLLVDPARFGALGVIAAVISIASILLTAAILTVSVAFVALLACRTVYPVADRLAPMLDGGRA